MKITHLLVGALMITACTKEPKQSTLPGRQLGESTASPGANASKPAPLTPDDPRVMNISAGITPGQAAQAVQAPLPSTANPPAPTPATPTTPIATPRREQSPPNPATSSTPVQPPADIAPATTAKPEPDRPGVFSPPPPPPQ